MENKDFISVTEADLIVKIIDLIEQGRSNVIRQTQNIMTITYFEIGKYIVQFEQNGNIRAKYAKKTLENLSKQLTIKFGKGFGVDVLSNMRKVYTVFQNSDKVYRKFESVTTTWSNLLFLSSFVLVDLKIGELTHQDLGQMQMYVNYYDRFVKLEDENPTIGIVLCKDKSNALVEITLPKDNNQIFATKYQLYLPDKEELKRQIENI
ncbi:MAG: DUF1016 family protein [Bacteroidetes bacterium]|nr:MAG: DUF1016 family protein [Bacteroidota bacterium]TAG93555.1 MAG: DUF1016 family protein [Bacteroidota bacterium]